MPSVCKASGLDLESGFDAEDSYVIVVEPNTEKEVQSGSPTYVRTRRTATESECEVVDTGLPEFLTFELSQVPEVEYIFTAFRANIFYVWIVTNEFEARVREKIYERQKTIIDEFPMFEFDFYVVAKHGSDVKELISGDVSLTFQRDP